MLLSEAKALGCNAVHLAHYPQNRALHRPPGPKMIPCSAGGEFPSGGASTSETTGREKAGRMIKSGHARQRTAVP